MTNNKRNNDIAIIGMAGRFPGAKDIDEFWNNICNKHESITFFENKELLQAGEVEPCLIANQNYVKAKGFVSDASLFDAKFFDFTQHDAEILDPQFRLFLETAWEAMENAAYVPGEPTSKVGVFAGSSSFDSYYVKNLLNSLTPSAAQQLSLLTYNAKDFLATLIAYKLNLNGPCVTIQTACSTSLVAICMACESLLTERCDFALAGGVSLTVPLKAGYLYQPGMIMSPDGHCRSFDAEANGAVVGNGIGVVVLKRYDEAIRDNDNIHAVIQGFAINNDGSGKVGFTAPSFEGQKKVIQEALQQACIAANRIAYIEGHGSGTPLGDAIEISALRAAYIDNDGKLNKKSIALGSVKPNIGHLDVAAGVAGLIKAVQALKHQMIPANINFSVPNSEMEDSPFYVNQENAIWVSNEGPRLAGVSSFGMGGTNAHVILRESSPHALIGKTEYPILIVLSAKNLSALIRLRRRLAQHLLKNPELNLAHVAYTLQVGRKSFEKRFACICSSLNDAIEKLNCLNELELLDVTPILGSFNTNLYEKYQCVAKSWLSGKAVKWNELSDEKALYRLPLPSYPFERREYWIYPQKPGLNSKKSLSLQEGTSFSLDGLEAQIAGIFKSFLGMEKINSSDDFFDFGGDSLLSLQVVAEIGKQLNLVVSAEELKENSSARKLAEFLNGKL